MDLVHILDSQTLKFWEARVSPTAQCYRYFHVHYHHHHFICS